MNPKTMKSSHSPISLAQAEAGHTYEVSHKSCSEPISQKLTLMGLGMGMVIELIARYNHGAVVKTSFGHMAVGSDLINLISVVSI